MQGKTHLAVGTAVAAALLRPGTIQLMAGGLAAAAFGSVISDIDAGTSGAGQDGTKVIALSVIGAALVIFADYFFQLDLYNTFIRRAEGSHALLFSLALLVICAFGILTRHRSFMHSLLAMGLMGGCIYYIAPALTPYFCIGFGSHLVLDLFNHKGIMLFYPFQKRFALGWFKSKGIADQALFAAAIIVLVLSVFTSSAMSLFLTEMIMHLKIFLHLESLGTVLLTHSP